MTAEQTLIKKFPHAAYSILDGLKEAGLKVVHTSEWEFMIMAAACHEGCKIEPQGEGDV